MSKQFTNKYIYIYLFLFTISMFGVSLYFSFEFSSAFFLLSLVQLYEMKNALNNSNVIFSYNPMKAWYKLRGKLKQYKKFATVNYIVFSILGIAGIVLGAIGIFD